jgi:hypothetical protein
VLRLAKQTKRTTLGHCYTPGDQAATWSKIANEGGNEQEEKVHWQEGSEEQACNDFLSGAVKRASQVFEDTWFDHKNVRNNFAGILIYVIVNGGFQLFSNYSEQVAEGVCVGGGGFEKGLYLSQEVV